MTRNEAKEQKVSLIHKVPAATGHEDRPSPFSKLVVSLASLLTFVPYWFMNIIINHKFLSHARI